MSVYILVNISIIITGLFLEFVNSKNKSNPFQKKLSSYFFIVPSFVMLFCISSFRGDFAVDYNNYKNLFESFNQFGFLEVFQAGFDRESGFIVLNMLIGAFTDNEVYLFGVTSLIILCGFYSQFKKYSSYIWLSVLMFVTVGAFYTSFNIMSQILAVSIVFAGSHFLYNKNFFKFLAVVLVAFLFHKSALIMLPFYFILNIKFNFRKLFITVAILIVLTIYLDSVLALLQNVFYSEYTIDTYGMTGTAITNTIVPTAIAVFCLFHYKKIDLSKNINNVWINAVVFYAAFSLLGYKVQMIQRLAEFFAPYMLLLVPLIFSKMKRNELKAIYMMGLVTLLILYNYVALQGTGYDPYYFV